MTNHDVAWAVLFVASFAMPKPWSNYALGMALGLSLADIIYDTQNSGA